MRWGIAGCGWLARDFAAPAIRATGQLVAAYDPDGSRARTLGASHATDDLDAFLATPGLEAVHVAAPNAAHAELTEACAAAGKHVLCEKPMATTLRDAERMVAACASAGVRYATAHNQRHHPAHTLLRGLVAEGVLGTVTQAQIHYACTAPPWWGARDWHFDPAAAGGGAVTDLAPHGLDLVGVLCDEPLREVTVLRQTAVLHEHPVEDGGVLAARYGDQVLATIMVSYACPETFPRRRLVLVGTEAMAIAVDTMGQDAGGVLALVHADGRHERLGFDTATDPFTAQAAAFAEGTTGPPERDLLVMAALQGTLA